MVRGEQESKDRGRVKLSAAGVYRFLENDPEPTALVEQQAKNEMSVGTNKLMGVTVCSLLSLLDSCVWSNGFDHGTPDFVRKKKAVELVSGAYRQGQGWGM